MNLKNLHTDASVDCEQQVALINMLGKGAGKNAPGKDVVDEMC